jgi:SNF2 family DNA or RNA helicase
MKVRVLVSRRNPADNPYSAHVIQNASSQVFRAVYNLSAKHRWCITGTPIQNRVQDLGALVSFLRVSPFDDTSLFRDTFVKPIEHGSDYGLKRLRSLVQAISLRRTKVMLELTLSRREELIQSVELDVEEKKIYQLFTKSCVSAIDTRGLARSCFQSILRLRQICNHGRELLPSGTRDWLDSVTSFNDTPMTQIQTCENCDGPIGGSGNDMDDLLDCFHQICKACVEAARETGSPDEPVCPVCSESAPEQNEDKAPRDVQFGTTYHPSSKVRALLENLEKARRQSIQSGNAPIKG